MLLSHPRNYFSLTRFFITLKFLFFLILMTLFSINMKRDIIKGRTCIYLISFYDKRRVYCSVWQLMWSSNHLFRPNSCAKEEQSGNVAINEQQTKFQIGDIFVVNNSSTLHCKTFYLLRLNYWSRLYIYYPLFLVQNHKFRTQFHIFVIDNGAKMLNAVLSM